MRKLMQLKNERVTIMLRNIEDYLDGKILLEDLDVTRYQLKAAIKKLSRNTNDPLKYLRYLTLRQVFELPSFHDLSFGEVLLRGPIEFNGYSLLPFERLLTTTIPEQDRPTSNQLRYGTFNKIFLCYKTEPIASCKLKFESNVAYVSFYIFSLVADELDAIHALCILLTSAFNACSSIDVLTIFAPPIFEGIFRNNNFITNGIFYKPWFSTNIWKKEVASSLFFRTLPDHIFSPFIIVDTNVFINSDDDIDDGWIPKDFD